MSAHVWYKCKPDCDNEFCVYCRGGLATCTVCTASEGELMPECPGRALTSEEKEAYYKRGIIPKLEGVAIDENGHRWNCTYERNNDIDPSDVASIVNVVPAYCPNCDDPWMDIVGFGQHERQ